MQPIDFFMSLDRVKYTWPISGGGSEDDIWIWAAGWPLWLEPILRILHTPGLGCNANVGEGSES